MEWQPIETAPRDNTYILLYIPSDKFPTDKDITHWVARWGWTRDDEKWIDQDDAVVVEPNEPTHWMPLPEPPK